MLTKRVIARLDIKGPHVVKGVRMEGLRQLGKPADFARRYYEQGADELLYLDIVANLYNREPDLEAIDVALAGVFVPVTVGGGVRTLKHIKALLRVGADKVAINTAAVLNPGLLTSAAAEFGASTLVLQLDAKWSELKERYEVYTHGGRERHDIDAIEWVRARSQHVAEVLVTSIDRDGTQSGPDLRIIEQVKTASSASVIAGGGIAHVDQAASAFDAGADAVAIATALHAGKVLLAKGPERIGAEMRTA